MPFYRRMHSHTHPLTLKLGQFRRAHLWDVGGNQSTWGECANSTHNALGWELIFSPLINGIMNQRWTKPRYLRTCCNLLKGQQLVGKWAVIAKCTAISYTILFQFWRNLYLQDYWESSKVNYLELQEIYFVLYSNVSFVQCWKGLECYKYFQISKVYLLKK